MHVIKVSDRYFYAFGKKGVLTAFYLAGAKFFSGNRNGFELNQICEELDRRKKKYSIAVIGEDPFPEELKENIDSLFNTWKA